MSDEKLRELERRFKETGSVEDEAAWLKERVRVGDLTQERLELAARLGHPASVRASGCGVGRGNWVIEFLELGEGALAFRLARELGEHLAKEIPNKELGNRLSIALEGNGQGAGVPSLLAILEEGATSVGSSREQVVLLLSSRLLDLLWSANGEFGPHFPQLAGCLAEVSEVLALDPGRTLSRLALEKSAHA